MPPQFARNPADALQCLADFLDHAKVNRDDPLTAAVIHDVPVYFISATMGRTLAAISQTFPLESLDLTILHMGFLVFERPTLFVDEHEQHLAPSGLHWSITNGVVPFWWEPPHFYKFGESHKDHAAKWVGALGALLRQKLAATTTHAVGKHVARRLKLTIPKPQVQIVTLRKRAYRPHGESSSVEWSCRWMVRGHWRVIDTGAVWVTAHFKGPDSKPLKPPTDRIFAVVR